MKQSYYDRLPRDYFRGIYPQVTEKLLKGENVCVSAVSGVGGKTFLNFFMSLTEKDRLFDQTIFFDPEIETDNPISFIKKRLIAKRKNVLVIIRKLEKIPNRQQMLEKLSSLQQTDHKKIVYLVITNHTAITDPLRFFGETTSFFSEKVYLSPFTKEETDLMISINNKFYGWNISSARSESIYIITGGIPRLIKHVCADISEHNADIGNLSSFLKNPIIIFEVAHLAHLLITLPFEDLSFLGLTNDDGQTKSLLLKKYLKDFSSAAIKELFPELSDQETKILSYLYENLDCVLALDKIQDLVEMGGFKTTPWAIYKLVSRVKPKIKHQFEIKNVKGKGYLLKRVQEKT